jgi:hypothetical protein
MFGCLSGIDLTLGCEYVHEMFFLRLSAFHNFEALLAALEIPDVRVHIEYGNIGV